MRLHSPYLRKILFYFDFTGNVTTTSCASNCGPALKDLTRTLIGGGVGGVYSYIHVLPARFLFKLRYLNLIWKETRRAEHEYMNIHTPPPPQLTF